MSDLFKNRVWLVTGAASGIGRGLAKTLASRGARLALLDRDAEGLEDTLRSLPNQAAHWTSCVDVSAVQCFETLKDQLAQRGMLPFGVINNAGCTVCGTFEQTPQADFNRVMNVNFYAPVQACRVFLPLMQQQGEGVLVNVSSVFGELAFPLQSAYCSSKFALRGFTETLQRELRMNKSKVRAVCVMPGGIDTNIARNMQFIAGRDSNETQAQAVDQFKKMAKTTADGAAKVILRGIENNRERVLIGNDARLIDAMVRAAPMLSWRLMERFV